MREMELEDERKREKAAREGEHDSEGSSWDGILWGGAIDLGVTHPEVVM